MQFSYLDALHCPVSLENLLFGNPEQDGHCPKDAIFIHPISHSEGPRISRTAMQNVVTLGCIVDLKLLVHYGDIDSKPYLVVYIVNHPAPCPPARVLSPIEIKLNPGSSRIGK